MPEASENTINDLMASYLRERGLNVLTQVGENLPRGRAKRTPDFALRDGAILYGEGEWVSSYERGLAQAIEYGDVLGASGYFIIGYPDELKERVRQRRITTADPSTLLSGVTYRGLFKLKGEQISLFRGGLDEISDWLSKGLTHEPRPPDATEFVHLMRDIVRGLTDLLPSQGQFPSLFEHIIATMPKDKGGLETARRAAAYLLLNQVVFYRILQQRGYPPALPGEIKKPSDLKTRYFDAVLKDDYQAIFDFDVASIFPPDATSYIRDLIAIVNELQPEQFTRDLLGNIFHALIPLEVRKPVAAYYTNPMAARLLAKVAIDSSDEKVADFACGSGTLLMAAYDRKMELLKRPMDEETHRRFVEEDLTGIDIMPFAAHLAVVQLALRNPGYITDRVRVAVLDSTTLRPGSKIRSLERVMPRGQATIQHFHEEEVEKRKVKAGAVSGAGAGRGFKAELVDVVIMNPPFTRKQHLKKDHRALLTTSFKDYAEYASGEQNLFGYFMLLADRFLQPGGRMAMVLPATVLRQLSSEGVRQLLRERYVVETIVQSGYRLAFSESSAFREILLVARKKDSRSKDRACIMAQLDTMPDEQNVAEIADVLRAYVRGVSVGPALRERAQACGLKVAAVDQTVLRSEIDWHLLLPGERSVGLALPESAALAPLGDVAERVVQGIRFHARSDTVDVKNTIVSKQRDVGARVNWRVEKETDRDLEAVSVQTGARVKIPKKVLRPTTRSASGMETMEIADPPDYIVVGRFPGDESFWDDPHPDEVLKRRLAHLESREAFLIAAGRNNVGVASEGTHFLAFVGREKVPPTWSFWSIKTSSLEDAKLLGLWWNSTFHLDQLIENRTEVGGDWMGWLRETLVRIRVLNPAALSEQSRKELLAVYDEWKDRPFPSLLDQLKGHFEGRVAIDSALAKAVGVSPEGLSIGSLYDNLASRLEDLRNIGGRG